MHVTVNTTGLLHNYQWILCRDQLIVSTTMVLIYSRQLMYRTRCIKLTVYCLLPFNLTSGSKKNAYPKQFNVKTALSMSNQSLWNSETGLSAQSYWIIFLQYGSIAKRPYKIHTTVPPFQVLWCILSLSIFMIPPSALMPQCVSNNDMSYCFHVEA